LAYGIAVKLTRRRGVGLALIGLSVLIGVLFQLTTGTLVQFRQGPVVIDGHGTLADGSGSWTLGYSSIEENVDGRAFYPLLGGVALGLFCFFWPERKTKTPPLISP
jgi:hypothetical protein